MIKSIGFGQSGHYGGYKVWDTGKTDGIKGCNAESMRRGLIANEFRSGED